MAYIGRHQGQFPLRVGPLAMEVGQTGHYEVVAQVVDAGVTGTGLVLQPDLADQFPEHLVDDYI